MNKFIKLLFFILIANVCFADVQDSLKTDDRQRFLGIAAGLSNNTIRDYGTSPLFYSGLFIGFQLDFTHSGKGNLFNYKFGAFKGTYIRFTNDNVYSALGNDYELRFSYLHQLHYGENRPANHYIGGYINNHSEIRVNSAFMNSSFVFDNISSLWFNYRLEQKYTKKERQKRIFFNMIKYKRKERTYIFAMEISMPIYSLVYRPGYNFVGNGTVNDDKILHGYKFYHDFFSGFNADISFTRLWKNGNAIKYSYCWNVFTALKRYEHGINSLKRFFTIALIYNLR